MAIVFAFCCLACAAANDLLFKFFAQKPRSRGFFVMVIGIVWGIFACFLPDKCGEAGWGPVIVWGIISGLFSVAGNILLIESMSYQSAGICSTIYRLNLALVVPGAAILYHEVHPWYQYIGIAFALLAVLLFLPTKAERAGDSNHDKKMLGLVLVIIASVLRAGMGLSYEYAFDYAGATPNGVNLINSFCWVLGGPVYWLFRERKQESGGVKSLTFYGGLSGLFVFGIVFFMAQAQSLGDAGIVLPIAQMSFILTAVLGFFFLKEKLSRNKIIALVFGVVALLLLSLK